MPDETENFLHQIVVMLPAFRAVEERLDRETGRRFSVFDLFRTDEPATSRFLDVLLNPKGAHGQGDLFLRLFIDRFLPEWRHTFSSGRAEPAKTNELLDVVISANQHWLGIENKIFGAPEQERQTDRYLDALKRASGQSQSGDYRLVYLSPKGERPTEVSFTEKGRDGHPEKLIIGAWVKPDAESDAAQDGAKGSDTASVGRRTGLDWLIECEKECRAENVRWFIRQFQDLVHKKLVQKEDFSMTGDAIVDLALRSPDNLDAALRIGDQSQRIREKVAKAVLSNVLHRLEEWVQQNAGDWELNFDWPAGDWTKTPSVKWLPILLRRKAWPKMLGPALMAEEPGPSGVFIGISAPTQKTWDNDRQSVTYYGQPTGRGWIDDGEKQAIAAARGLAAPRSPWWVNMDMLRGINGQDLSDWTAMETVKHLHAKGDELAKQIVDKIGMLAQKVDATLG